MATPIAKRAKVSDIVRYGLHWLADTTDLEIEMTMIQKGGRWNHKFPDGKCADVGKGLQFHFLKMRSILWPERYEHRWTRLIYKEIIENQITILLGPASAQKTSHIAEWLLMDYWCFPNNTCVLMSTTSREKLELAVWGEVKMLFYAAREKFPDLAGHVLEGRQCISTDSITEDGVRDLRKGMIGRSCYVGHQFVGLGTYAGIKQERFRFMADELGFMPATFLACLPNMRSNTGAGGLKVIGSANANHDPDSQLGIVAEPKAGWGSVQGIEKTTCWDTKFTGGRCVNLIGIDSPNLDTPEGEKELYPRLIGRQFISIIEHDYGRNSPEWESQVMGRMRMGLAINRVITRKSCEDHHAHDNVIWMGTPRTFIYGLDPSFGGGDRCIGRIGEFGKSIEGKVVLYLHPPRNIKLNAGDPRDIEMQIVEAVYSDLIQNNIPPQNCFYDSFGKGTMGFAFAQKFGYNGPVPVDAGARPTRRPVREDLYVYDELHRQKRPKRCDEEYSKFVTEMWFSVRYAIEAEQIRNLDKDTMLEGCMRNYEVVAGNKKEVEPKDDMKQRMGKSPDLFDALAILVEGARQRGFTIGGLANNESTADANDWLIDLRNKQNSLRSGWALNYQS